PICYLRRRTTEEGGAERFIDTARKFFNLDPVNLPPRDHQSEALTALQPDEPCDCELTDDED
ncbi:MAG: glutamyl-tRNA reductase, partial [Proteobacteria bacterium]|nr:glutamyl-tRNA reductase [Pseudomonadota bacterium]